MLLMFIFSSFTTLAATKKIVLPNPNIQGLSSYYVVGSIPQVYLYSTGYSGNVQYRVLLVDYQAKKTIDLTKGYTKSFKSSYKYRLTLPKVNEGRYSLTVYVKRAGQNVKYDKSLVKYFNVYYNKLSSNKDNTTIGSKLSSNLQRIKGNVYILHNNVKYQNAIVEKDLIVKGNNANLNNIKVLGNLILDPGVNGNVYVNKVEAKEIKILSGAKDSIHLNDVKAEVLTVDSKTEVRVVTENAIIESTKIATPSIIQNQSSKLGEVEINLKDSTKPVEFRGIIEDKVVVKSDAYIKTTNDTKINNIEVAAIKEDSSIKLEGNFEKVEVSSKVIINISENAKIEESLVLKEAAVVKTSENAVVNNVEIKTEQKDTTVRLEGSFKNVTVQSESKIEIAENTKIEEKLVVNSSAEIKAFEGAKVTNVEIKTQQADSTIKLDGSFENVSIQSNSKVELAENTKVEGKLEVNSSVEIKANETAKINTVVIAASSQDTVKIEAKIETIEVNSQTKIELEGKSEVNTIVANEKVEIVASKETVIEKVEGEKKDEVVVSGEGGNQGGQQGTGGTSGGSTGGSSGGFPGGGSGSTTISVESITLSETAKTLRVREIFKLNYTITPSNATNQNVTWQSSDNDVASVDSEGNVTAKKSGTAIITVRTVDGNKTATCVITVIQPVTDIDVDILAIVLKNGDEYTVNAKVFPDDASNKAYTVEAGNILSVEGNKIKATSNGETNVEVKSQDDPNKKKSFKVKVSDSNISAFVKKSSNGIEIEFTNKTLNNDVVTIVILDANGFIAYINQAQLLEGRLNLKTILPSGTYTLRFKGLEDISPIEIQFVY